MGIIVPTGIATDATTQYFFKDLIIATAHWSACLTLRMRKPLFDGVAPTLQVLPADARRSRYARTGGIEFAFFAARSSRSAPADVRFELTPEEIQLLNPNTGTCPVFRSRRDAEITLGIYRRVPVLINENDPAKRQSVGNQIHAALFHMSNDSNLFHTRRELEASGWTCSGNVFTTRGRERCCHFSKRR